MRHSQSAESVRIAAPCGHVAAVKLQEVRRPAAGCEDCLKIGGRWLHLRTCLSCGHVGCCDSSPNRHATKHFHTSGHPIVTSAEPGETWIWCYVDEQELAP
ncbi:MAG TPA: UBP-type zinc finger domain-containing protein [Thermoanaerobaculia bacterium]|nr:UBP-type zinc finger domain-containing protein [Thermoanaerobaculia bacterium]